MTYSSFVTSRFKTFPTLPETLLHATVGMVGEAVEAHFTWDRKSLLLELGDFDFYLEALKQQAPVPLTCSAAGKIAGAPTTLPDLLLTLVAFSADTLDLAKKAWAYNKPVEELCFWDYIPAIDHVFTSILSYLGVSRDEVRELNMAKLRKRYPDGYSDSAAQARADQTEERHG